MITVLMSVYNADKYLRSAIDSILNQTYTDLEFIIINDGSTDLSRDIICSYIDKRITLIDNDQNRGLIFSLNKGIEKASGKYIARIDADDLMKPSRIAEQVAELDSRPNVAVVGSWMEIIDEKGITLTNWELPYTSRDIDFGTYLNGDTTIGHPCVMFRTDVVRAIGGYRSEYIHAEDVDLWFRIELAGHHIRNIPKWLTSYRQHDSQITKQNSEASTHSHRKALADYLSEKLKCVVDSETAALMIPSNFTNHHFRQQKHLNSLYELKLKMFKLFSEKHKLTTKETFKYAYKLWWSLFPLCKLRFTNPFKVIFLNSILFVRLIKR